MFLQRIIKPIQCYTSSFVRCDELLRCVLSPVSVSHIHTSHVKHELMEFFDDKKNWGASRIFVGRSWRKEELRIKSNTDLHKLWYVLLKEKNMLLTMEHECRNQFKLFPNPERIDKVLESMHNLEEVVRERNRAYFELETGETGERPAKLAYSRIGLTFFYKMMEHIIPKHLNKNKQGTFYYNYDETKDFLSLLREKLFISKRKAKNRDRNHVKGLLKRYPDIDIDHLKKLYPDVNIEKEMKSPKTIGHRINN